MYPDYLETESTLDTFLAGFEQGTFPKEQWTHGAHIAMAASYIVALPRAELLSHTRERIKYYNLCQGGQNTEDAGYHETLTVFWLLLIEEHLETSRNDARLARVRNAYATFATCTGIWRDFYSFDVIKSRDARRVWIPPDLKALRYAM